MLQQHVIELHLIYFIIVKGVNTLLIQTPSKKCLNTKFFLVRIQSEYGKIQTRKNSVFEHFARSEILVNGVLQFYFI